MGRIGPVLLLAVQQHEPKAAASMRDIGGMLHKAVQLVGDYEGAEVLVFGSIDPAPLPSQRDKREQSWVEIARLTEDEPYKHHTGWVRWIRLDVIRAADGAFGVAGMGED